MRICADHWAKLRQAISDRGLDHLVAKSGEAAMSSAVRQLEGDADPKHDFDPLMNANFAIWSAYISDTGLIGLSDDRCPLCEVERSRAGLADNWIRGCSEDQLQQARELGLVSGIQ